MRCYNNGFVQDQNIRTSYLRRLFLRPRLQVRVGADDRKMGMAMDTNDGITRTWFDYENPNDVSNYTGQFDDLHEGTSTPSPSPSPSPLSSQSPSCSSPSPISPSPSPSPSLCDSGGFDDDDNDDGDMDSGGFEGGDGDGFTFGEFSTSFDLIERPEMAQKVDIQFATKAKRVSPSPSPLPSSLPLPSPNSFPIPISNYSLLQVDVKAVKHSIWQKLENETLKCEPLDPEELKPQHEPGLNGTISEPSPSPSPSTQWPSFQETVQEV